MRQPRAAALVAAAACVLSACTQSKLSGNCELGDPAARALAKAGPQGDGSYVLLNGRRIAPVGTVVEVGTFPIGLALSAQGVLAVGNAGLEDISLPERVPTASKDDQSVDFIDADSGQHLYTLPIRSNFVGLAWHPSGATVYVAGGGRDVVRVLNWDAAAQAASEVTAWNVFGYPTGLRVSANGDVLYATLLHRHALVALDTATGAEITRYTTQAAPYAVELDAGETRAYVSNWSTDTVSVIDLVAGRTLRHVTVGKNPTGIAVAPDGTRIYVAVADEDRIAILNRDGTAVTHWDLRATADAPVGISPTDVRLSPDGTRLYVVAANENAVLVLNTADGAYVGAVPTAQYPTEVEVDPSGTRLYAVSAKGFGAGPNVREDGGQDFIAGIIRGTVQVLDLPDAAGLAAWGEEVAAMNDVMKSIYDPACAKVKHPVPLEFGKPSPVIKHVVYIMRENKTYDSLLGDLGPEADGDPELAVFAHITPNLHALARRFGNLTNFYNESEQSVQGHIWGANGVVNDFSEKTWIAMWTRPGEAQLIVPGMEPGSRPKYGDLFQHFLAHGVGVRNYGEYLGVVNDVLGATTDITNWKFPSNFYVEDRRKVREFLRELEQGRLEPFTFIALGNDHTLGLTPGAPTPEFMIAENDEATGMIVEAISKSPFWHETVIFLFEDDPQGNADHIDAHRSINIVISPWVKRGAISRVTHSFPSIHKTTHLILGVPPIHRQFEQAAGIYEVFDTEPANSEPFTAIPSPVPYKENPTIAEAAKISPKMERLARESLAMDFSAPDQAPELGRLLWEYFRDDPFPRHLATFELEDEETP